MDFIKKTTKTFNPYKKLLQKHSMSIFFKTKYPMPQFNNLPHNKIHNIIIIKTIKLPNYLKNPQPRNHYSESLSYDWIYVPTMKISLNTQVLWVSFKRLSVGSLHNIYNMHFKASIKHIHFNIYDIFTKISYHQYYIYMNISRHAYATKHILKNFLLIFATHQYRVPQNSSI